MSDKVQQGTLFEMKNDSQTGPVTCLGMTFENDESRRAYFTEELRKKLPELKNIDGFPIGEDRSILALSDPPYYTACPNPWILDIINDWVTQKPPKPEGYHYHREPFAADVSEGKNDPIYNAHSYHTKVPHKAIMRYILHYTDPGDIVYDGFCGTGMTGVAAQLCGDRNVVMGLGYQVKPDGTILKEETNEEGKTVWLPFSKLGERRAVLNDLSPAATFIANNYNTPINKELFEQETKRILFEVEKECSWMYETRHSDGHLGVINYTVWSDVFVCPECTHEVIFWDVAVDKEVGSVRDKFPCPNCDVILTKRGMERAWVSKYDIVLKDTVRQAKQVPVLINYTINRKRVEKAPDASDLELIERIEKITIPYWIPNDRLIFGQETRRNDPIGITHVHQFYSIRNLYTFSVFYAKSPAWLKWILTGSIQRGSKQHQIAITRIGGSKEKEGGATAGHRRGTLYIPSNQIEMNAFNLMSDRSKSIKKALFSTVNKNILISTSSSTIYNENMSEVYDYLFFDPPFGSNIAYSELNSIQESWLGVTTNQKNEAIEDKSQKKSLQDYHALMRECFMSANSMLKPGRWMTVEFSNTSAAVWNVIQSALQEAGFIVANVSALDKKRGGLNAIIGTTAVKQDLAISAYKPNGGFEERFSKEAETHEGVWDFVRTHLKYLPIIKLETGTAKFLTIIERDPRILYDQVVAYYVRKGYPVPISSQEFQAGLSQRFPVRDGMYFLPEQVVEYDRKKMVSGELVLSSLFVCDENSAIQWLRQQLLKKPQTRQDLHLEYMREIQHISKHELLPELDVLLEQNFLQYEVNSPVPSQIHTYLSSDFKDLRKLTKDDFTLKIKAKDRWYVPDPNKQADLEKLREKSLLREFEAYRDGMVSNRKKLKQFRTEAIRAGFKKAWSEKDYQTIVTIGERLPENVLQEDDKLLMYYDNAQIRLGL
ncbi:DNA methyltransferase [Paenibacillus prosopidis]|uniref:DNA methylase n=1 Tax=Paenibacillus prosopidis TaxID=630520 RepID=A0A368WEA6_9BACL|nr:DNA methyltransferase [Paenibacillus prosopidis]RCW52054.1 DNA methylase [Paenibacillus prosopidis]